MSGPLCLIVNPAAGHGRSARVLAQVEPVLAAAGAAYLIRTSTSLAHAAVLAAEAAARGETIVSIGGDGLAGTLAGAAAVAGARYGLIPAGRGNDLAGTVGIPADPRAAAEVLLTGAERRIDLLGVGVPGHAESVVAGSVYIGIPAQTAELANAMGWLRGPLVYPVAALRVLARWRPVAFSVRLAGQPDSTAFDGTEPDSTAFDGFAVVVANASRFGGGMRVAPAARIDDGLLDLVLMRRAGRLTVLRALAGIRSGRHLALPQISTQRGTNVTLLASRDLTAAADGEPLACASPLAAGTPLHVRILPGALRVLAPARRLAPVAAQERGHERRARGQLGGAAGHPKLAAAHHIGVVGDGEHGPGPLLHDQHRGALRG
ncbi:MAG: diacylglycerol/lipid kinase family protein [Streptosporangiaceae bacterium]